MYLKVDLYKLGMAFILLGLMFPVVDFVSKYDDPDTSLVTMFLWFIGVVILFVSAFVTGKNTPE